MLIRLQKYLADCGVASRRKAEELILDGTVSVNGKIVRELGTKVETDTDIIVHNGKTLNLSTKLVYIMLHKPEGYVCTVKDQFERPTVLDLLSDVNERIFPVGRLDYDTSGLLILTNDGDLTYKLTHPKHNIDKTYRARLKGVPTKLEIENFRKGIYIEDYRTAPAEFEVLRSDRNSCVVKITIKEGKNRQVRKMCESINHDVTSLKRIATGKLDLGALKKGGYRNLLKSEIEYLKSL